MSWWDFQIGYTAGQEAARNEQSGNNGAGCLLVFLYIPSILELGLAALGVAYLVVGLMGNAKISELQETLIGLACIIGGSWLYLRLTSIIARTPKLRLAGALGCGALWTFGLLYYLHALFGGIEGIFAAAIFFMIVTAWRGYAFGMYNKRNTPETAVKRRFSDLTIALLTPVLTPLAVLLRELDRGD